MERQKGELLFCWQKKLAGMYIGDHKVYSFQSFEIVDYSDRPKAFKALFYTESLAYADLSGANLRGADLRGANLRDVDLRFSNLYGANLTGADLTGADLRSTNLYCVSLSDIKYDKNTVWPEGFKP